MCPHVLGVVVAIVVAVGRLVAGAWPGALGTLAAVAFSHRGALKKQQQLCYFFFLADVF